MVRYHVSASGVLAACRAKGVCPLGGAHFDVAARDRIQLGAPVTADERAAVQTVRAAEAALTRSQIMAKLENLNDPTVLAQMLDMLIGKAETPAPKKLTLESMLANAASQGEAMAWVGKNKKKIDSLSWEKAATLMVNYVNAQSYGPYIERRFLESTGLTKVNPSDDRGDGKDESGHYFEVKASVPRSIRNRRVNFVQIRPYQKLDGYHMLIVEEDGKTRHFYLTKEEMDSELIATNSSLAHGVRASEATGKEEYAIRFAATAGDKVFDRWVEKYEKPFTPAKPGK